MKMMRNNVVLMKSGGRLSNGDICGCESDGGGWVSKLISWFGCCVIICMNLSRKEGSERVSVMK